MKTYEDNDLDLYWDAPSKIIDKQYREMLKEIKVLNQTIKSLREDNLKLLNSNLSMSAQLSNRTLCLGLGYDINSMSEQQLKSCGYEKE